MNNNNDNNNDNDNNELKYDDGNDNELSQKKLIDIRNKVARTNFDNLFNKKILTREICIPPDRLNKNINDIIKDILNQEIDGICIEEGYVKPNSNRILLKSERTLNISNFKAAIYYTIKYETYICNPSENEQIKCFVSEVNKSNIRCYVISHENSPLNIFLAKQHHIGNDEYMKIKEGDLINIIVINKKYEYHDKEILIIGKFMNIIN